MMLRLIYNFFVHNKRKVMTIRALLLSAQMRMLLVFVPIKHLRPYLGVEGMESSMDDLDTEQRRNAFWISDRVNRVAQRTPWQSKCFVRALVAQRLLSSYGMASTLYLGVGKDEEGKMIAHAWLRSGPYYVTGGTGEEYATVARFGYPKKAALTPVGPDGTSE